MYDVILFISLIHITRKGSSYNMILLMLVITAFITMSLIGNGLLENQFKFKKKTNEAKR